MKKKRKNIYITQTKRIRVKLQWNEMCYLKKDACVNFWLNFVEGIKCFFQDE